jgi:uncharacterized protein
MHYAIFVKFNSSSKILVNGNEITICLRSKPKKGKANRELTNKLATYFGASKNKVHIISGLTSTRKLVEIQETTHT